jgi:hypothetical protein
VSRVEWLRGIASPTEGERGTAARCWRVLVVCLLAAPLACAEEAPSVIRIPGLATDTPGGLSPIIDLPFSGAGGSAANGGSAAASGGSGGTSAGGSTAVGGSFGGSPCEQMGSAGESSGVSRGEAGAASTGGGCSADLGGAGG